MICYSEPSMCLFLPSAQSPLLSYLLFWEKYFFLFPSRLYAQPSILIVRYLAKISTQTTITRPRYWPTNLTWQTWTIWRKNSCPTSVSRLLVSPGKLYILNPIMLLNWSFNVFFLSFYVLLQEFLIESLELFLLPSMRRSLNLSRRYQSLTILQ